MSSSFFAAPQTARPTSAGPVDLPILYYDATCIIALFWASRAGALDLLAGTGLEPTGGVFDHVLAGMAFYEYRHTSVGPYNEVGLALFAVPAGTRHAPLRIADVLLPTELRRTGMVVVDLPVTTEIARAAGAELWGYPKFVTDLPFTRRGDRVALGVADPGGGAPICTFEGTLGRSAPALPVQLLTFTQKDGALVRTPVAVRGPARLHLPGSTRLFVGASRHGMAERMRALGLDGRRPAAVLVVDPMQARLPEGEVMRRGAAPTS